MKMSLYQYIYLIGFFMCSVTKESIAQNIGTTKDITTIKKLEYDWLMAEFRLDTATISAMMDDSFVSVGMTGLLNKQEELEGIYKHMSNRRKDNHVVDSLYLDDLQVKIYENTAVVTFFSVTRGSINGIPFINRRTRMYDVWIKRDGKWKAVSSQVTPIR